MNEEMNRIEHRLEELQAENEKFKERKEESERKYFEEQKDIEDKIRENEELRKKLLEEETKLQESFSSKVGTDIEESKKIIGFIKRYVLIGIITGVPGIALAYIWDKWQENKMLRELYSKNIESVANPNNKELAKEYELLRNRFYKAYDIDGYLRHIKDYLFIGFIPDRNLLFTKVCVYLHQANLTGKIAGAKNYPSSDY